MSLIQVKAVVVSSHCTFRRKASPFKNDVGITTSPTLHISKVLNPGEQQPRLTDIPQEFLPKTPNMLWEDLFPLPTAKIC